MFKSIFLKQLTTFGLIILLSFVLLISIITSIVNSYSLSQNSENVKWTAAAAKATIEEGIKINNSNSYSDFLLNKKENIEKMTSAFFLRNDKMKLFITDMEGNVVLEMKGGEEADDVKIIASPLPERVLEETFDDGEYYSVSDLYTALNTRHIVYGHPIVHGDGQIVGAVYAGMEYTSDNSLMSLMMETVITACLWIALAALIAAYFMSERIVSPLRNMATVSKKFAKGNFSERVAVVGRDEIADLSVAFNNMADSLEEMEEMRNSFIGNVSHDLRTPMTTILGFIEGINSGAIPEEKHSYYLNIIASEVKRLSRLVNELLDITKLESGKRKFVFENFDICEMARLILISFEQKIEDKKLEVEFECFDDNVDVYADKDAIHQALYNLCDNAIKFSREGGLFRISILRADHGKIKVSVYNEGEGIAKEDIPHVFDRFYKSDRSRGLDKTGSGLGLYIAKTVIEAQDEKISLNSTAGEYCEFVFTLTEK
ncbi:MAG: HAMP domain-containing protein [Ruminococcaceae bacterium]|nr:HAMP domain-containing protein [Oscillospiraceae bacterium]